MITAVDLLRGLAELIGWRVIDVPGATGYIDTDYAAKGRYAVAALEDADLVCVHVEATDEASHDGDAAAKIQGLGADRPAHRRPALGSVAAVQPASHAHHAGPSHAGADEDALARLRAFCDRRQRRDARRGGALRRSHGRPLLVGV